MLQKVQKYIEELNMISSGDRILVGVSGGADSVCLLLFLYTLYREKDVSLEAVHVEHGIRGEESRQDAAFVEKLCQRMNIPCQIVTVDVPTYSQENGLGLEEAARILRYEAFVRLAKEKHAKIALAHHMEDNAETILFQMIRGSSLTGLCGMQPIRRDMDGICYIRPLLKVHRKEIEDFLMSHDMEFRVDSTNQELDYSRNYLRKVVVPALTEVNVQAVSHMNETAAKLLEIKDFLDSETEKHWAECQEKTSKGIALDTKKLFGLHPVIQRELLYRAIAEAAGSRKDIGAVHVEALKELCENQSGKEIYLPYGIRARKEYEKIWLLHKKDKELSEKESYLVERDVLQRCLEQGTVVSIPIGEKGEQISLRVFPIEGKSKEFPKNSYTKWMDYDKIEDGFCIRTRKSGDYFICDENGHRKKIKQYFVDEKIPASQREEIWLLTQEHLVLWAVGGRMSEHTKITSDTKSVIEITYQGRKVICTQKTDRILQYT